jgi:hypothetical protein
MLVKGVLFLVVAHKLRLEGACGAARHGLLLTSHRCVI